MQRERRNARYLADTAFPELVAPTADLGAAVAAADDVLVAVPSHALRETLTALAALPLRRLAWATKGFELETGLLPYQVAGQLLPASLPTAVLSGPRRMPPTRSGSRSASAARRFVPTPPRT